LERSSKVWTTLFEEIQNKQFITKNTLQDFHIRLATFSYDRKVIKFAEKVLRGKAFLVWIEHASGIKLARKRIPRKKDEPNLNGAQFRVTKYNADTFRKFNVLCGMSDSGHHVTSLMESILCALCYDAYKEYPVYLGEAPSTEENQRTSRYTGLDKGTLALLLENWENRETMESPPEKYSFSSIRVPTHNEGEMPE
jgi:hypothetical protein